MEFSPQGKARREETGGGGEVRVAGGVTFLPCEAVPVMEPSRRLCRKERDIKRRKRRSVACRCGSRGE